jgi:uncharacterized membrane protein YwzB
MPFFYNSLIRYSHFAKKNKAFHTTVWMLLFSAFLSTSVAIIEYDDFTYAIAYLPMLALLGCLSMVSKYKMQLPD